MPGSSSSGWRSPTSIASRASRRPSPSARRTASAIRGRRWAPSPRSTTTCACSSPASAAPSARTCGVEVVRETAEVVAESPARAAPRARGCSSASTCRCWRRRRRRRRRATTTDEDEPTPTRQTADVCRCTAAVSPGAAAVDALRRKGFGRLLVEARRGRVRGPRAGRLRRPRRRWRWWSIGCASTPTTRSRITDSVEIAYQEGGGAAWVVQLGEDGAPDMRHVFSERFECRDLRAVLRGLRSRGCSRSTTRSARARPATASATSSSSTSIWWCRTPPSRSRRARSSRGPSRTTARYLGRSEEDGQGAQRAARRAVAGSDRRSAPAGGRGRRRGFAGVRGFFDWLERKKYKVHVRVFLSRYRGYQTCPDCAGTRLRREARAVRVGGQTIDQVSALTTRQAQDFFDALDLSAAGRGDRRQGAEGDPAPAGLPERRRPRVPDARSAVVDAVGRGSAAHQPGDVARARRWSARSTCSTSRRSACTRATTCGSSPSCASSAIRATR